MYLRKQQQFLRPQCHVEYKRYNIFQEYLKIRQLFTNKLGKPVLIVVTCATLQLQLHITVINHQTFSFAILSSSSFRFFSSSSASFFFLSSSSCLALAASCLARFTANFLSFSSCLNLCIRGSLLYALSKTSHTTQ